MTNFRYFFIERFHAALEKFSGDLTTIDFNMVDFFFFLDFCCIKKYINSHHIKLLVANLR